MRPQISIASTVTWFAVGAAALAIALPAPRGPANAPSSDQTSHPGVVASAYLINAETTADPALARLNSMVWRRGQKPPVPPVAQPGPAADAATPMPMRLSTVGGATRFAPNGNRDARPDPGASAKMIAISAVNVHASPGSADRLFTLQSGEGVEIVTSQRNWVEVKTASGGSGWVYSKFLQPGAPH